MNMITVRELRTNPGRIWKGPGPKGDLVLTNNGQPVAIICPADENTVEERLRQLRRVRAMEAVESIQRRSIEKGLDRTTPAAIDRIIKKARRGSGR